MSAVRKSRRQRVPLILFPVLLLLFMACVNVRAALPRITSSYSPGTSVSLAPFQFVTKLIDLPNVDFAQQPPRVAESTLVYFLIDESESMSCGDPEERRAIALSRYIPYRTMELFETISRRNPSLESRVNAIRWGAAAFSTNNTQVVPIFSAISVGKLDWQNYEWQEFFTDPNPTLIENGDTQFDDAFNQVAELTAEYLDEKKILVVLTDGIFVGGTEEEAKIESALNNLVNPEKNGFDAVYINLLCPKPLDDNFWQEADVDVHDLHVVEHVTSIDTSIFFSKLLADLTEYLPPNNMWFSYKSENRSFEYKGSGATYIIANFFPMNPPSPNAGGDVIEIYGENNTILGTLAEGGGAFSIPPGSLGNCSNALKFSPTTSNFAGFLWVDEITLSSAHFTSNIEASLVNSGQGTVRLELSTEANVSASFLQECLNPHLDVIHVASNQKISVSTTLDNPGWNCQFGEDHFCLFNNKIILEWKFTPVTKRTLNDEYKLSVSIISDSLHELSINEESILAQEFIPILNETLLEELARVNLEKNSAFYGKAEKYIFTIPFEFSPFLPEIYLQTSDGHQECPSKGVIQIYPRMYPDASQQIQVLNRNSDIINPQFEIVISRKYLVDCMMDHVLFVWNQQAGGQNSIVYDCTLNWQSQPICELTNHE